MGKLSSCGRSTDLAHLADQVKPAATAADVIGIDVMDAHLVPPLTHGPVVVAPLRPSGDAVLLHAVPSTRTLDGPFDALERGLRIVTTEAP